MGRFRDMLGEEAGLADTEEETDDNLADMAVWMSDAPQEQKAKIALKHLGRDLGGARIEWSENALFKGGKRVFPTDEMLGRYGEKRLADIGKAAEGTSVGYGTRAAAGIKISPEGRREASAELEGGVALPTPSGDVVMTAEGPKMIDQPPRKGQIVHGAALAFPYLAPMLLPAAEVFDPGSTAETIRDTTADLTGEAIEFGPEIAAEVAMRRTGAGALKRIPTQGAAAGVGTALRRTASAFVPGRDISIPETATRALGNAALSVGAEALTALPAEAFPISPIGAPSAPERYLGKKLIGKGDNLARAKGAVIEQKTGVRYTPAQLGLDEDALGFEDMLRSSPGMRKRWADHDAKSIIAASKFTNRRIDALLGLPTQRMREGGRKIYDTAKSYFNKLDSARKRRFAELVDPYQDVGIVATNAREKTIELRDMGYQIQEIQEGMTIGELKTQLSKASQQSFGKGVLINADRSVTQWVGDQMQEAFLKDLGQAAADPSLRDAAEALTEARASYAEMSIPIRDAKLEIVRKILGAEKKQVIENLPSEILGGSERTPQQIETVMKILGDDPQAAMITRRGMFDEAIAGAEMSGKTPFEKRLSMAGEATGETYYSAPRIAERLRANKAGLVASMPVAEQMAFSRDIGEIIDMFDRLRYVGGGSRTEPMIMVQGILRAIASPKEAATQAGMYVYKSRLSDMLLDPARRDMLVGLKKTPKNALARTLATTLEQLAAVEAIAPTEVEQ